MYLLFAIFVNTLVVLSDESICDGNTTRCLCVKHRGCSWDKKSSSCVSAKDKCDDPLVWNDIVKECVVLSWNEPRSNQMSGREIHNAWKKWKDQFSPELGSKPTETFKLNYAKIAQHNEAFDKGDVDFTESLGFFANMNDEERKAYLGEADIFEDEDWNQEFIENPNNEDRRRLPSYQTGLIVDSADKSSQVLQSGLHLTADSLNAPSERDWKKFDTPVRNQGSCGSCWAFATTAMVETHMRMNGWGSVDLSEQELAVCASNVGGCGGGWPSTAMKYIKEKGVASEAQYGYNAGPVYAPGSSICSSSSKFVKENLFDISANVRGEARMAQALANGPLVIAFAVGSDFFSYSSGIYNGHCADTINHAMTLVGYTDDYWLVRNSWGTGWGMGGYVAIRRFPSNGDGKCSIARYVWGIENMRQGRVEKQCIAKTKKSAEIGDYAACAGMYKDNGMTLNGQAVYQRQINTSRFFGYITYGGWVNTGSQWLNAIVKDDINVFGGFQWNGHSSFYHGWHQLDVSKTYCPSKCVEITVKPGQGDYAGCAGIYKWQNGYVMNGKALYRRVGNDSRFIAYRTNGSWACSGSQWLSDIHNRDVDWFGHFQASTNGYKELEDSYWASLSLRAVAYC